MTDGYGNRTAGQVAWLALAVALVVTLLVGGGWLAFAGARTGGGPRDVEQAPGGLDQPAGAVAFGAPSLVDGVPWDYRLDADGAAAAAVTAVAVTGQRAVVFDDDRFGAVAAVVFTADEAAVQAREVDAARAQFETSAWTEQPESRRTYHFAPLGVRLVEIAARTATAEVWAMTLVGVGDAGGALFTTSTVALVADGGTWKVAGLDTVEGPTPVVDGAPSPPGAIRGWVRDASATLPLPLPLGTGP